jgi:hypothetical protein
MVAMMVRYFLTISLCALAASPHIIRAEDKPTEAAFFRDRIEPVLRKQNDADIVTIIKTPAQNRTGKDLLRLVRFFNYSEPKRPLSRNVGCCQGTPQTHQFTSVKNRGGNNSIHRPS